MNAIKQVVKRDGIKSRFNKGKIKSAIKAAIKATKEVQLNHIDVDALVDSVVSDIQQYQSPLDIEKIQDAIENVFLNAGLHKTNRAFIVYREKRKQERNTLVDVAATMDEYLNQSDWRIKANANSGYSLGGLILNTAGKVTANYWLDRVYNKEIGDAHRDGSMHIHDLDIFGAYCLAPDTKIKLLSGESKTIKYLAENHAKDTFYVYSWDHENNKMMPGLAHSPRMTRQKTKVLRVHLDNGSSFVCTPDHKIVTKKEKGKEAQYLSNKERLQPLYVFKDKFFGNRKIIRAFGTQNLEHRYVYEAFHNTKIPKGYVVHHIDGNKDNNDPRNLEMMLGADHRAQEVIKTMQTNVWKENNNKRLVEYNSSEEKRNSMSSFAIQRERDKNGRFLTLENHKVERIEWLDEEMDVYCLTVEKYHNFALDCGIFVWNCAGWSLRQLLEEGFNGVPDKIESAPPKHLSAAVGQIINFLGTMQNEWAGAQAFSSFDTYMAAFVRKDKLDYTHVKQCMQEMIYSLNVPSRWASQCPFTNLTFDLTCPDDLKEKTPIIGGEPMDFKYGELQAEMDMINKAYIEIMTEGDYKGRIFTFPIPTYNMSKDFQWDSEISDSLFEMTAKYGLPYFQNFINSDLDPGMIRSMCPLTGDTLVDVMVESHYKSMPIKQIYEEFDICKLRSPWLPDTTSGKPVKVPMTDVYKFTLENGVVVRMGENHLQPTQKQDSRHIKTIKAKEIHVGDRMTFSDGHSSFHKMVMVVSKENLGHIQDENLYCFEVDSDDHLFVLSNGLVTHNCRLQLDLRELLKRGNGLFGSAEKTGSAGVVTINCARLGYQYKGKREALYERLDELLELAKNSLEKKREVLTFHMDNGLFPYSKRYLGTLDNHFSTIGVNGINEMIRNFSNDEMDITHPDGQQMAIDLLLHIREKMTEFQEETGHLYNLEATPAEGTTYRFAKEDKKRFKNIIQAGCEENPYYTNSSQLPVGYTDDPFTAMIHQEPLQQLFSGGTVLHLYMNERISNSRACKALVRRSLEKFRIPYITISPTFSICPKHGYLTGEHEYCPHCDEELIIEAKKKGCCE